jgi:hypothetical protein
MLSYGKTITLNKSHLPLFLCLVERVGPTDYEKVFHKFSEILPYTRVKEIVSDFEKALWKCVKKFNFNPMLKTFKNV